MTIDGALLNITASLVMLAVGITLHFYFRPKIFETHAFIRNAFQIGVMRWLLFAFEWVLLQNHVPDHFVIATFDFLSMVDIAFCWLFFSGDTLKTGRLIFGLAATYTFLICWNFGLANAGTPPPIIGEGPLWIRASEFTSAIATGLIALVFFLRYKGHAVLIGVVQIVYAVLQLPSYGQLFFPLQHSCNACLIALVIGKLLSGSLFYTMFFLPGYYEPFHLPSINPARLGILGAKFQSLLTHPTVRKVLRWGLGVSGILLLHVIAGLIVELLRDRMLGWLHAHWPTMF